MILTVCMSPSIDITVEVDSLNVGRSNAVKSKAITYSGKALNVAVGVRQLGAEAFATGFMYRENGAMFERELDREGVSYSFIWNNGRVRENYKIIDKRSMLTEINDVGYSVRSEAFNELLEEVTRLSKGAAVTVISGGLPRGTDSSFYQKVFEAVAPNSLRIADTEGAKLFAALGAGVDLVKPNRAELELSLGREIRSREEMLSACRELIERGASKVLLSLGSDGAVITDGSRAYYCKSINVAVNSTVGAGDAMVAAAAVAMEEGATLPEILRAGVAAGTAAVTVLGSAPFAVKKYEEIYAGLDVTEF